LPADRWKTTFAHKQPHRGKAIMIMIRIMSRKAAGPLCEERA
jgi:hypothetical protein